MKEKIKKILEFAIFAPSGENLQPWKFKILSNSVKIFLDENADHSIYNYKQRASYLALGALFENIEILSKEFGLKTVVKNLLQNTEKNLVCEIFFEENLNVKSEPGLYTEIKKRCTNRKPYKNIQLTPEHREEILKNINFENQIQVQLIENEVEKIALAKAISATDQLIFENQLMHEFLFKHLRWTEEEEKKEKNGLYLKTLELKPPQIASFKIFKNWKILNFLNHFGIAKFIATENAKIYTASSAIGGIFAPSLSNLSYFKTGKEMQRLWLYTTKLGISFQPLTGIPFLNHKFAENNQEKFAERHVKLICDAYDKIQSVFKQKSNSLIMLFRIGYGGSPSATSSRKPLEDFLI